MEVLAYIAEERERQGVESDRPYDVVAAGYTPLTGAPAAQDVVGPYVEAGATWWIERFHAGRGPLQWTRERVQQGPPRI